ncbi:ParA family protein [Sulfurimonas sp.]|jgi:chromosome partitioning protein|uniref:ParA family protein n=1 Tax=Sulfurimonas sp. TaxID=2022749 RepID=UPI0025D4DAE3|nr:ParA family protein [Sulfurimonas sp.]MCK9473367.1 ParA family protein [Sulfurimonas sp.]
MIITIAHTKGGVGKSTLAWHLAHSFENKKVTIIDLDFQQTLYFVNIIGGDKLNVLQPLSVDELINELGAVATDDICIVDVGGFDSDINRAAIEHSDKIVIPISESVTEVLGFRTFEGILKELKVDVEKFVVLNNIHPLTKNFGIIEEAISKSNMKLLNTVIRSRKIYRTTMGEGNSIFGVSDNMQAKEEILGVSNELRCNK